MTLANYGCPLSFQFETPRGVFKEVQFTNKIRNPIDDILSSFFFVKYLNKVLAMNG